MPTLPTILPVRRLSIDLSRGFAPDWFARDGFRSQIFNAASMMFPQGEQFFIDSLRAALPALADAGLREQIRGFAGQEAAHRHLHTQYNAVLEAQGLHYVLQRWIAWRIRQAARLRVDSHVAITAAYEHYTALLARLVLDGHAGMAEADAVPRRLWSWHAAEELEHRTVAFDVYRALGGSETRRRAWFAYVSLLYLIDLSVQTLHNLHRAGLLGRWRTWREAGRYLFGARGVAWRWGPHALGYFSPRFHPARDGSEPLAAAWFAAHAQEFRTVGAVSTATAPPAAGS